MKIMDSEVIKNAEHELMDGITAELDWTAIERVFREKHHLNFEEDVQFRKGELVPIEKRVGYKLDFDVKLTFSILLDREGNFIALGTTEPSDEHAQDVDDAATGRGVQTESAETKDAKGKDYKAVVMAMSDSEGVEESASDSPDGSA